jgi:hypothetical protein
MRKQILLIILSLGLGTLYSSGQTLQEKLSIALDSFSYNYPVEKVFVHTDRSAYTIEESVWFKAYCTLEGVPSFLSRIVYIELTDENNTVVEKRMLPLVNGSAYGDFYIGRNIPSGTYSLNAYTSWMLNFPQYIFRKPVRIYNTDYKKPAVQPSHAGINIHFLPEGGSLVTGVSGVVAFKASGPGGIPVQVSGEIVNTKNARIAGITTVHDGMGYFELKPEPGESYRAVIRRNGMAETYELPKPLPEGIVLHTENMGPSMVFFRLERSSRNSNAYNKVSVVGRMNNTIVFIGNVNFDETGGAGAISKKNLPSGILQLTVFSELGVPLAERLVFVNNVKSPGTDLKTDTSSTAARKKNVYTIDLSGFKNLSASVSVTSFESDSNMHEDNLLGSLLLSSELKGYISNTGYYFKDKEPATLQALDLVMLTHGWRNIKWTDLQAYKFPSINYPVESEITIRGKINRFTGKPIVNSKLDFIIKTQDSVTIFSTVTPKDDRFVLSGLNFKKTASLFSQGTNVDKTKMPVQVTLFPSHMDTLRTSLNIFRGNIAGQSGINDYFQKLIDEKQAIHRAEGRLLETVTVTTRKVSPVDSVTRLYASPLFSTSDQNILVTDAITNVWQFLRFNIAGLSVGRNEAGETTVFFTRSLPGSTEATEMDPTTNIEFYLNEIRVSKDVIESMDPADFILVKVWKGTSAMALGTEHKAIAFYTEKNRSSRSWMDKGFDVFKKEGYSVSREFYSVDYEVLSPSSSFTDIRPTLYWNPNLTPDKNGTGLIRFFNDDATKTFKVVIEGIDAEGKVLSIQKVIR